MVLPATSAGTVTVHAPAADAVVVYGTPPFTVSEILAVPAEVPLTLVAPAWIGVVITGVGVCASTVVVAAVLIKSPVTSAVTDMVLPAASAGTVTLHAPAADAVVVYGTPPFTVSEILAVPAEVPLTLVAPAWIGVVITGVDVWGGGIINWPSATGLDPTVTVAVTVLVAVLITETVLSP